MSANLDDLLSGSEEVLLREDLLEKISQRRPLTVKAGFDPTKPDLHLGHFVLINKLSELQKQGHLVKFVVGDFTALIGDPAGRDSARPPASKEEVQANAATYARQAFKVLDRDKSEIHFNSSWLGKLSAEDVVKIAAKSTVARMLERDDFRNRYRRNFPIGIHEFLYPLFQAWDSVVLNADIELGGTDQKFNLLLGREMQKSVGQAPQVVITMPIIEGLDGHKKMSKSLGNYIAIDDPPTEMFGKIMSISDELMWKYYSVFSSRSSMNIQEMRKSVDDGFNPKDAKRLLAGEIVAKFHGGRAAGEAEGNFARCFVERAAPSHIVCKELFSTGDSMPIASLLKESGMTASTSEALRMITQNAVRINGVRISDKGLRIDVGTKNLYQIGRRKFLKVKLSRRVPAGDFPGA